MLQALLSGALKLSPDMARGRIRYRECPPEVAGRLEYVFECFIGGYNLALASRSNAALARELDAGFDSHHVGFAYEGAGMALALLDLLNLRSTNRLQSFITREAVNHDYITVVGAGLAAARAPWAWSRLKSYVAKLDPLVSWCMPDGFGFHQGFFYPERFVDRHEGAPEDFTLDARRLFDSGVARSLWWTCGASPELIARTISGFEEERRPELWCGIGIACAYAGGDNGDSLAGLRELSHKYLVHFLSGLPFAARMRQKAGTASPVTEEACRRLLARSADEAASMAGRLLQRAFELLGDRVGREGYGFVRRGLAELLGAETAEEKTFAGSRQD
jgi:hypothetical protein